MYILLFNTNQTKSNVQAIFSTLLVCTCTCKRANTFGLILKQMLKAMESYTAVPFKHQFCHATINMNF